MNHIKTLTCIRSHADYSRGESSVEPRYTPFLGKPKVDDEACKMQVEIWVVQGWSSSKGLNGYGNLMVDGLEGVDNAGIALVSLDLEGQPGTDHVQGVCEYHCSYPCKHQGEGSIVFLLHLDIRQLQCLWCPCIMITQRDLKKQNLTLLYLSFKSTS